MRLEGVRRKTLELGVYLPVGAALAARDLLLSRERLAELFDDLVGRGRETLGGVSGDRAGGLERITLDAVEEDEDSDEVEMDVQVIGTSGRITPPVPEVLPIEQYDDLTDQEVVARLDGLTREELEAVRAYEREHRSRSIVLQAIEPLMGELPIQGYDQMTAEDVIRRTDGLSQAELELVRDYEARTRARSSVLERIDRLTR